MRVLSASETIAHSQRLVHKASIPLHRRFLILSTSTRVEERTVWPLRLPQDMRRILEELGYRPAFLNTVSVFPLIRNMALRYLLSPDKTTVIESDESFRRPFIRSVLSDGSVVSTSPPDTKLKETKMRSQQLQSGDLHVDIKEHEAFTRLIAVQKGLDIFSVDSRESVQVVDELHDVLVSEAGINMILAYMVVGLVYLAVVVAAVFTFS